MGILLAESGKREGTLRAPPYGDIVNVVVSLPGLPPSDFPGNCGVDDGGGVMCFCVGLAMQF